MNAVGRNLKKFRCNKRLTQDELAERISVSRKTVSSWETGRTEPDIASLQLLADVLGVTIEELIYGKRADVYQKFQQRNAIRTSMLAVILFALVGFALYCSYRRKEVPSFANYELWMHIRMIGQPAAFFIAGLLFLSLLTLIIPLGFDSKTRKISFPLGIILILPIILIVVQYILLIVDPDAAQPVFRYLNPFEYPWNHVYLQVLPFASALLLFCGLYKAK